MIAPINTQKAWWNSEAGGATLETVVLHSDHLASHAFDEVVERAAFEAEAEADGYLIAGKYYEDAGSRTAYSDPATDFLWLGWIQCAKSRAKRARGVV
jgi:hypothetical protein